MSKIDKILKHNLCVGCGICEMVGKDAGFKMVISDLGFYIPQFSRKRNRCIECKILNTCPSINIAGIRGSDIWGDCYAVYNAYSKDKEIRIKASSGGVISALAIFLLEYKQVDAVLHVGNDDDSFLYNSLRISRTREEVIKYSSSRYAPALVFDKLLDIFSNSEECFCFIGKPCDIQAVKNVLKSYPQYANRIKYFFSIFCAGIPSYDATMRLLEKSQVKELPCRIKYRGDGWPGYFKATYQDGSIFRETYSNSWGKVLGRDLNFRCKICPDGIGLLSDISVGDAWETTDGYPDFSEKLGRSFVIIRNEKSFQLFSDVLKKGYLEGAQLDKSTIKEMQPYQYLKRKNIAYKLLPICLLNYNLFRINYWECLKLAKGTSLLKGIKTSLGTIARYKKWR